MNDPAFILKKTLPFAAAMMILSACVIEPAPMPPPAPVAAAPYYGCCYAYPQYPPYPYYGYGYYGPSVGVVVGGGGWRGGGGGWRR